MDIRGETTLELGVGDQTFPHSVVVGDIGNSAGIQGTVFMQKHGCLLDLAQGTMQIGTQVVQLKREAVDTCARVQVCDTVIVPPRCEAFVKGSLLQASFDKFCYNFGRKSSRKCNCTSLCYSMATPRQNRKWSPTMIGNIETP